MDQSHRPTREGFASVNPMVMHACAHDGHTAVGRAVAEIVARYKDQLNGRVRLMFQPAEEGVRGAYPMVKAGAVTDVDLVIGLHIADFADDLDLFVCGAVKFLATTKMDAVFRGKSAQGGSRPEQGKNALLAATTATNNLYAISRHSGGATRVCVGKLTAGEGRNVVAPWARLVMETRGDTSELNKYMETEARRIIKASADMWDCTHEIIKTGAAESAISDQWTINFLEEVATEMGVHGKIQREGRCLGSDDFTFMMQEVQKNGGHGSYCIVGSPLVSSHHSATMDWDDESMPRSAEILVRAIWKFLG
jgi:aminobenzoyl-glutamate utilization protein A